MLSFRTTGSPVQGRDQPAPSEQSPSPADASFLPNNHNNKRLDSPFDLGSPGKLRSPLRHSICLDDDAFIDPLDTSAVAQNFKQSIDLANKKLGRSNMSYTGDDRRTNARERIPAWWRGQGEDSQLATDFAPTRSRTGSDAATPKNASPAGSSRFAFFTSALKGITSSPVSTPADQELVGMDIEEFLRTQSSMSPVSLLHRFQEAYQQRTVQYQELKAERDVQQEEHNEAETRIASLKMQLEGMAQKALDQEVAMQTLIQDLAREKKLRAVERQQKGTSMLSEVSSVSEDLGVEEDQQQGRWNRRSDMGFETDDDSIEEASLFSRSRSPTAEMGLDYPVPRIKTPSIAPSHHTSQPVSQSTSVAPATTHVTQLTANPMPLTQANAPTPRNVRVPSQPTTFQKLFGSKPIKEESSCRNCQGQHASVAWDTVNLLKDENKGLKVRVGELETAVEGALDVVRGLGL